MDALDFLSVSECGQGEKRERKIKPVWRYLKASEIEAVTSLPCPKVNARLCVGHAKKSLV